MYQYGEVNLPAVYIANGLGGVLMLLVLLSGHGKRKNRTPDGIMFNGMCLLTICLCVMETYTFWLDGKQFTGARASALVVNALIFALDILFAFLWSCYTDYKMLEDSRRIRRVYPFVAIPALMICLLSLANLFTGVFFTISPENVYARAPGVILVYLATYGYLMFGAANVLRHRRKVGKYLFMPLLQFLIPVFVGSLIQLLFYGIALIWASVALGLTSLCLNLQNEESYVDSLTGLYNRNYLIRYLDQRAARKWQESEIWGMMVDINEFKRINDTFGHWEGDRLLRRVGQLLLQSVSSGTVVARYGGDEFVILLENQPAAAVQKLQQRVQENLDGYNRMEEGPIPLSLAIGVAEFDGKNVDDFVRQMDRRMYQEKRAYYERQALKTGEGKEILSPERNG